MAAEYELILMLDPETGEERREEIAGEAKKRIDAAGTLRHSDSWGTRKLAYEIQNRTEADYRFFRFESEPALLDELDHTLKISDGILRFRVFKVDPRSPLIEPPTGIQLGASSPRGGSRRDERGGGRRDEAAPAEPAAADSPPPAAAPAPVPAAEPAEAAAADAPAPADEAPAPAGEAPAAADQAPAAADEPLAEAPEAPAAPDEAPAPAEPS